MTKAEKVIVRVAPMPMAMYRRLSIISGPARR
jgi:hypothetical protein